MNIHHIKRSVTLAGGENITSRDRLDEIIVVTSYRTATWSFSKNRPGTTTTTTTTMIRRCMKKESAVDIGHLTIWEGKATPHLSQVQVRQRLRAFSHSRQKPGQLRVHLGRDVRLQQHQVCLFFCMQSRDVQHKERQKKRALRGEENLDN